MPRGDRMHKSLDLFPISGIDSISGYVSGKILGQFLRLVGTCILLLVGERDVRPSTRQIQDDRPSNPPEPRLLKWCGFQTHRFTPFPCFTVSCRQASRSLWIISLEQSTPCQASIGKMEPCRPVQHTFGLAQRNCRTGSQFGSEKSVPYPSAHPGPPSDGDSHTPARRLPVSVPWTGTIYGRFPVPRYPGEAKKAAVCQKAAVFRIGKPKPHILISHSKITGQGNRGRGTDNTPVQFRNIQFFGTPYGAYNTVYQPFRFIDTQGRAPSSSMKQPVQIQSGGE